MRPSISQGARWKRNCTSSGRVASTLTWSYVWLPTGWPACTIPLSQSTFSCSKTRPTAKQWSTPPAALTRRHASAVYAFVSALRLPFS